VTVITKSYVATSRGALHVRMAGAGTPLVLLQILPFASLMFEPALPLLAARGYRAIAFDLMGYGRSDKRDGVWMVEDFAANVLEGLDVLGVMPEFLVGGHFTALIGTEIALRRPQQVKGLVLDGVPVWTREERETRKAANPASPPVLAEDGAQIQKLWASTLGLIRLVDPDATLTAASEARVLDVFIYALENSYKPGTAEAFFGYDTDVKLRRLAVPTLIVGSPTDTLRRYHETALAHVPGAQGFLFTHTHPLYGVTRPVDATPYVEVLDRFFSRLMHPSGPRSTALNG
jgi:pimeloyl-ACP methyl ester carboxylesterase